MVTLFAKEMTRQKGPPQGKRPASDNLDGDQRLAKRFNLMHLDGHGGKRYIPITSTTSDKRDTGSSKKRPPPPPNRDSEWMQVEDTKDRVYIHDLDEELAELESDDEHPIFIPDIEKHLIRIPHAILFNDDDKKKRDSMQLILYNVPSSISVPENKDSVRKAILESRQRARQNQGLTIPEWATEPPSLSSISPSSRDHNLNDTLNSFQYDEDAMDTT